LGQGQEEPIILFIGRFDPLKGLNRLFEAVAQLKDLGRLRLMVIGGDENGDPRSRHLRQMASDLGIDRRVDFIGRIDHEHLPAYYGAADAVVIPSYYESFGLVGLEALACGRPVVSTPVGVIADLAERNNPGVVMTQFSPASFARGIEFTLGNLSSMGAERIRAAVSKYNWPIVAEAVQGEYQKLFVEESKAFHPCCCSGGRPEDGPWPNRHHAGHSTAACHTVADHSCCI